MPAGQGSSLSGVNDYDQFEARAERISRMLN